MLGQAANAIYECADGKYIFVTTGQDRWDSFCAAMALPELAKDERFDGREKRSQKAQELKMILEAQFATKPAAVWDSRLKAAGLGASILKDITEVYDDPQVVANQMIVEYQQPGIGPLNIVNAPFKLSSSAEEPRLRRPVPYQGEHTREVLEELGYTQQEIETFHKAEAIGEVFRPDASVGVVR